MDLITTAVPADYTPPGTSIIHPITASLVAGERPGVVHITQYDQTLPIIAVRLMGNNVPYAVPAGAAVNFRARKPDGKYIYNPALGISEDGSTAYIAVTPQTAAAAGKMRAVIEIVLDGAIAATANFCIEIAANPVPQDAIDSQDEYLTIQDLMQQAREAAAAAKESETAAADSASASATSAAESQTSAQNAVGSAQSASTNASAAQASAQDAATSAAQASASAEAAASSEAAAAQYAEEAKEVSQKALGYYVTEDALRAAHPTGQPGNWAIVGNPDGIWVWDVEGNDWVNSGQSINLSDYYTKTQTDAQIDAAKGTAYVIFVTASGWQGNAAPYTNTVPVEGMTSDIILSSVQLAPQFVGNAAAENAMALCSYVDTMDGAVQVVANDDKPVADFAILAHTSERMISAENVIDVAALTAQILLAAHPVGSYYWSRESTDPSELFGGEWERITNKFVYALDDGHEVDDEGGEEEHTTTTTEMPTHTHVFVQNGTEISGLAVYSQYTLNGNSYGISQPIGGSYSPISLSNAGEGEPHNNMPPYIRAYCWRRTA